ncbi:MAG: hypothetical protein ACK5VF_03745 [Bacteroidota bacterium]
MRQGTFILMFLLLSACASAQTDLLAFKKNGRTIQSWSSGSYIVFQMENRQWLEGFVRKVWRDSVRVDLVKFNRVVNNWGFYSMDTARMGLIDLHVKELRALPKKNFSYNIFTNGQLFKLGAIGYTSLNIINNLSSKDPVFAPENASRLGIAGLVYLGGALLGSFHRTYWEVGKRYRFVIVPIAPPDAVQRTNKLQ